MIILTNKNGKLTKSEIVLAVQKYLTKGKLYKMTAPMLVVLYLLNSMMAK